MKSIEVYGEPVEITEPGMKIFEEMAEKFNVDAETIARIWGYYSEARISVQSVDNSNHNGPGEKSSWKRISPDAFKAIFSGLLSNLDAHQIEVLSTEILPELGDRATNIQEIWKALADVGMTDREVDRDDDEEER